MSGYWNVTNLEPSDSNGSCYPHWWVTDVHSVSKGEDDQGEPDYEDDENQQQSPNSILDERAFLLWTRGWVILKENLYQMKKKIIHITILHSYRFLSTSSFNFLIINHEMRNEWKWWKLMNTIDWGNHVAEVLRKTEYFLNILSVHP